MRIPGRRKRMPVSPDETDIDSSFTVRGDEIQRFEDLIGHASIRQRLVVVHSELGGVGKTRLLRMYGVMCKKKGIPVARVDFGRCQRPEDIVHSWQDELKQYGFRFKAYDAAARHLSRIYCELVGKEPDPTRRESIVRYLATCAPAESFRIGTAPTDGPVGVALQNS